MLVVSLSVCACALTEKGEALEPRLFAPPERTLEPARQARPTRPLLQLGTVSAASHLKANMVVRTSPVEFGVYQDREWTERPERYVERSLGRALFGRGIAEQTVGGLSPTLDADLLAFEEIRAGNERRGRVTIHFTLHDDERVWVDDTITEEQTARSARAEDIVEAIGGALDAATTALAKRVGERLSQPPPTAPDQSHTTGAK
jgi:cholesterol transport system auxiliary component